MVVVIAKQWYFIENMFLNGLNKSSIAYLIEINRNVKEGYNVADFIKKFPENSKQHVHQFNLSKLDPTRLLHIW